MRSKPKIVFRVDSNKKVGLGHIKRCLALGAKFQEQGHEVLFVGVFDDFFQNQLIDFNVPYQCLDAEADSQKELSDFSAVCQRSNAEIVVIDVYEHGHQYYRRLMEEGYYLVAIHDTGMPVQAAHMIINGSLNAQTISYHVPREVMLLLGIDYLMMPSEYWNLQTLKDQGKELGAVKNILITMGGVDQYDLTTRILRVLDPMPGDFTITVIAGPYYENTENIVQQIKRMKKQADLVSSPPSLFPYIKDCSLAISSAGQTLYQLAALGRPTLGISLEKNQAGHLRELGRMGVLMSLMYEKGNIFEEDVNKGIAELINNSSQRIRLAQSAAKLVDGQGADRVFKAIVHAYRSRREKYVSSTKNSYCP